MTPEDIATARANRAYSLEQAADQRRPIAERKRHELRAEMLGRWLDRYTDEGRHG